MPKNPPVSSQRGTNTQNNPQTRDVNAANRVAIALKLRAAKMTYEQIAAQCGYNNASSARKAILRELDRVIVRNVEELRQEELLTLDMLQQKCYTRMESKDHDKAMLFAVDRLLQIQERRAKLLGMDQITGDLVSNKVVVRETPAGYFGEVKP